MYFTFSSFPQPLQILVEVSKPDTQLSTRPNISKKSSSGHTNQFQGVVALSLLVAPFQETDLPKDDRKSSAKFFRQINYVLEPEAK